MQRDEEFSLTQTRGQSGKWIADSAILLSRYAQREGDLARLKSQSLELGGTKKHAGLGACAFMVIKKASLVTHESSTEKRTIYHLKSPFSHI